ncbi:hypothetical protein HPT25_23295 [Bacillus sp. BRMEA1]|uniref:hypothetical protein n=1 Tax=Neobacillus endophyticus TaxID=2738405 RepID=UPI001C26DC3D|nr:hypothetical protein [Neobacillus endophyticus]NRD80251.1 hypothetical protein [Neobacillus endophyticus]
MKGIKLSEFVRVSKPEYIYLKLIPNNSVTNTKTHYIARTISNLWKSLYQNIKVEERKIKKILGKQFIIPSKLTYQMPSKVSYYIYMEKKKIEFYFIVPKHFETIIKEKINNVWHSITIEKVETIPLFTNEAACYEMVYKKEDGLALKTDRRDSYLLQSNLNIVDVMEEGDRVGVFYNFIPTFQPPFLNQYRNTIEKIKSGKPVDRNKYGLGYALKVGLSVLDGIIQDVASVLGGKKKMDDSVLQGIVEKLNGGKTVSESTERKGKGTVLNTQILLFSESPDLTRQQNNVVSLNQSYEILTEDNKLIAKPFKKKVFFDKYNIGAEINKVGDQEAQNFIQLTGRDILERHHFIEKVNTHETQVPDELRKGVFCIGTNTFRGNKQKAYLTEHHDFKNLLLLLIGPTRAGKSNFISHLSIDAVENGECVIIFDFIKKNELSDTVANCFPSEKVLNIEVTDVDNIQGMGYNEAKSTSTDPFKRYTSAKLQNSNLIALINAVKADGLAPLSSKMKRYLEASALVVFSNNGAFKDVVECLQDHVVRYRWIRKVPKDMNEYLDKYVAVLQELDEFNREGDTVIGTKIGKVDGILDRMNELTLNPYIELMLNKDTTNNINLAEEIQKNQVICIRMKGSHFPTNMEKDVLTTYWLTKIMLALEVREDMVPEDDRVKVNLVIDELYQVENCEKVLKSKLSQIAKFRCKPIVSCHYINQLTYLRSELRSANTSYMLIAGCDEDNFKEISSDLAPFTYETSLKTMSSYHSLNRIKTKDGYATFITKLPGKVEDRKKKCKSILPLNLNE